MKRRKTQKKADIIMAESNGSNGKKTPTKEQIAKAKKAYAAWREQYDAIEKAKATLEPLAQALHEALTSAGLPTSFTSADGMKHSAVKREDRETEDGPVTKTTYMVKTYGEREPSLTL